MSRSVRPAEYKPWSFRPAFSPRLTDNAHYVRKLRSDISPTPQTTDTVVDGHVSRPLDKPQARKAAPRRGGSACLEVSRVRRCAARRAGRSGSSHGKIRTWWKISEVAGMIPV